MRRLGAIVVLAASIGMVIPAWGEERHYLERTGDKAKSFAWILEQGRETKLTARSPGETHLTFLDRDLATRRWELTAPAERTAVTARRVGNRLILEGSLRGKSVAGEYPIDKLPWYQALSLSLGGMVKRGASGSEFWMLRPDTLEPVRMQARRLGKERISVVRGEGAAIRVKVTPAGLASLFWQGRYWFSPEGVFLRYEGASGPPGSPKTIVILDPTHVASEEH